MSSNVSYDLLWALSRTNSSYLVKRNIAGGVTFSSEPLNVEGVYTPRASGFVNKTAVGVVQSGKNIKLLRKSAKAANQPRKSLTSTTFHPYKEARKIKLAVSKNTVDHRPDQVKAAVLKASALARSRKIRKTYASRR